MSVGFQFKQFFIAHDQCAMKVNTDGILLGAIANTDHTQSILDLGTGTALIALMLAQRFPSAQITALELDLSAFQQAGHNVAQSPWSSRIKVVQADMMQWKSTQQYDLIVANPPYFEHSLATKSKQRDLARSVIHRHIDWLVQAKKWLNPQGKISFILPFDSGIKLIPQAEQEKLYCIEHCKIKTTLTSPYKRSVLTFSLQALTLKEQELTIYNEHHQYSDEFKQLTKDFYLNI